MCQYCTRATAGQEPEAISPQEQAMEAIVARYTPDRRMSVSGPAASDRTPSGAVTRALAAGRLRTVVA